MRAICPSCGGKIHTQPKGFLGSIAIGANGALMKTGTTCEHCGVALTGKVTPTNYAVLADAPTKSKAKVPKGGVNPKLKARPSPPSSAPPGETREEYLKRVND